MTVTYDTNAKFMGVSMTRFRDLLRQWLSSGSVSKAAGTKLLEMDPRTAAALVDEAEVQGLFGFNESHPDRFDYGHTEAGAALLAATPMKAITRKQARETIDALLERCNAINARNDLHFTVDRVWLFGSYVKGTERINDIDVVIETGRTPLWDVRGSRFIDMACQMGGESFVFSRICPEIFALEYIESKLINGARKNPRISKSNLETLKSLACECQLVFDRKRGGPISDAVLDRHPDSKGRSDSINAPRVMPELNSAGTLAPVSLDFVDMGDAEAGKYDWLYRETGIWGELYSVKAIASWPGNPLSDNKKAENWIKSLGHLDARHRCVLMHNNNGLGRHDGILVERSIHADENGYDYILDVADVYRTRGRRDPKTKFILATKLVCAIGSDMEKISRHAKTLNLPCDVRISIKETSDNRFAEELISCLYAVLMETSHAWVTDYAKEAVGSVEIAFEADEDDILTCALIIE